MKDKFLLYGKLCIIFLIFFSSHLYASWTAVGPYHKNIRAVSISPTNSNILFAAAFGSGIYRSTNGGLSWINDKTGFLNTYARCILALSDSLVFCGTNEGIYKSTDGGNNWFLSEPTLSSVRSLAFDSQTNSIYAATYGTFLYKSPDLGDSWSQLIVKDNITGDSLLHERAVAIYGKDSLYVGGSITDIDATGGALFKSTDGGTNWTQVQPGLAIRSSIMSIAISPNNPDSSLIIGTAAKGVYKSTNGGINWLRINGDSTANPLPDLKVNAVGFNTTFRYAGTDSTGGFYSRALGDTTEGWKPGGGLPGSFAPINSITIDPQNRALIYVGTEGEGVYRSGDSGQTWSPWNTGMLEVDARSLALTSVGRLVLGTGFGDKIWISTDNGANWQITQNLSTVNSIFAVIPSSDSLTLFAAAYGTGVYKSTDGGNNWILTDTTTLLNRFVKELIVDHFNPNTVYVGTGNGVFKTTDGGENWFSVNGSDIPFSTSIRSMDIHPTNSSIVYAGTDNDYLYKTTDGGASWTHITSSNGFLPNDVFIRAITIDKNSPNVMYVGSDSGHVYKSTDGGNSWNSLTSLLTNYSVREILVHPSNSSVLFAATFGSGIFVSQNGGTSWSTFNTGLTDLDINTLISNNAEPLTLYAGSSDKGVFVTNYSSSGTNHNPSLSAPSSVFVIAGNTVNFLVIATDQDLLDTLVITKNGVGNFSTTPRVSPDTGYFSWLTAMADTLGSPDTVSFTVNDGKGGSNNRNTLIYVSSGNHMRGDITGNGSITPGDLVGLINFLFKHGTPPNPLCVGDVNCTGNISTGDLVYLINLLFRRGPGPCTDPC